jgi:ATP-binding cassette subfamily B (MDR/TAP) protein 6
MVAQANGSTAEPDLIQLEEEVKEEGSTVVQPDDKPDDGADDAGDAEPVVQGGFDVPSTVDEDATKGETAISYADAVKISPEGGNDSLSQQIQDDIEQPSIEAEGATVPPPQPTETPRKTPGEVRPTPEKRVSFPQSRNLPTSESQSSNLSDFQSSETSSTPQRSSSQVELASTDSTPGSKDKGKSRKRLDSLKGFVRRISDQNVNKPLSRSNSTHSATGAKSPMGEPDESTALIPAGKEDKKKKRLSLKK